jgi:hypothetical protein
MVVGIELNTITGEFFHPDITTDAELTAHTSRVDNPHNVTAAQVGAVSTSLIGVPNGIVPLESDGKIDDDYLPASIAGGLDFQGLWDATSGSPPSLTPSNGQYWVVNVAGNTNLDGITDWDVGDFALYDGNAGVWRKIDNSAAVVSVNGYTGVVVLNSTDTGSLAILNNLSDLNNAATARTNLGLGNVEDVALSTWAGSTNLTTLGTITTGTWQGTPIADAYIASASAWNTAATLAGTALQIGDFPASDGIVVRRTAGSPDFIGRLLAVGSPANGLSVADADGIAGNSRWCERWCFVNCTLDST